MSNLINKKIVIFGLIGLFAMVTFLVGTKAVSAEGNEPAPDSRITTFTVTPASTASGATTNYEVSFTLNTAIAIPQGELGIPTNLRFNSAGGSCPEGVDWSNCQLDLSNATISGLPVMMESSSVSMDTGDNSSLNFMITTALDAGTTTFTVNGAVNPSQGGGYYQGSLVLMTPDVEPSPGVPWPEGRSTPFLLGDIAFYGKVVDPDGDAVPGTGVNIRDESFGFNQGTGTDQEGNFAFTSAGLVVGTTYFFEFWPPNDVQGIVAPDPIERTYTGSAANLGTISFATANKTISGKVEYDTGGAVTVAEVWASKQGGGTWLNTNVGSDGTYSLAVSGGEWEVGLNPPWDPDTNSQVAVNWTYNQPPTFVSFANNNTTETETVNFITIKTNAIIKGKIVLPNGTPLSGGWVELRTGEGFGNGAGIDGQTGRFTANVKDGSYGLMVWPDTWQNPNLARYYLDEVSVTVLPNQTVDLGTLTMSEKTASISGKVMLEDGTGVSGVRVNCWPRADFGWGEDQTAADGSYKVWVAAGQYECNVDTWDSNYIPVRGGGPPEIHDLSANESITGVNHTVKLADATLTVKTVDSNGNALSDIRGWAFGREKGGGWESEYGSGVDRGVANIPVIGGKTYIVGIHMDPGGETGYILDKEVEATVAVGGTKEVLLTLVAPDAEIYGFVQDQNGNPVLNTEIEIFAERAGSMGFGMNTRVNQDDGSFSLGVLGGEDYVVGYWLPFTEDYVQVHPDMVPFRVPVNGSVVRVLTAFKADSQITATVLGPDGDSVSNVWVWCNNYRSLEDKLTGDFAGGKEIDTGKDVRDGTAVIPIVAGDYDCGAGQWGGDTTYMPPEEVSISVTPSSPASITLQFREPDGYLRGSVTFEDGTKPPWGWCYTWNPDGSFSGGEIFDGQFTIPLTISNEPWFAGCDSNNPDGGGFFRSEEVAIYFTSKGDIAQDFVLTEASFDIPEGVTIVFDASQQQVINLPDGTVIAIPAGALAESGNITLTATPNINLFRDDDNQPINYAWDIFALDSSNRLISSFNSSVTITIPYDGELLDELGIDEEDIIAKYYDETAGAWKMPEGTVQNTDEDWVAFSVDHFTDFAITSGTDRGAAATILAGGGPYNLVATPLAGGGPQVGVYDKDGNMLATWFAYTSTLRMGITTEAADLDGDGAQEVITVPNEGYPAQVRVFDKNGNVLSQFFAYPAGFTQGINLAVYDLDGDGTKEIITAPAKGTAADVKVFDQNGNLLARFNAYGSGYTSGAGVLAGDLTGDGTGEIVTYTGEGSGQVRVFDKDGNALTQFNTYGTGYNKGIGAAIADLDGDGNVEIITTPKDAAAHVKVFDNNGNLLAQFMGYAETFKGGAKAYAGDVDGDGDKEIVLLPGTDGSAQARIFDKDGNILSQFFAYPTTTRGSFVAVVGDVDGDGSAEIAFAPSTGLGPQVRIFDRNGNTLSQFFTLHSGFRGGISLSVINQ